MRNARERRCLENDYSPTLYNVSVAKIWRGDVTALFPMGSRLGGCRLSHLGRYSLVLAQG